MRLENNTEQGDTMRGIALLRPIVGRIASLALAGCANNMRRTVEVHQPLSARPLAAPAPAPTDGAIFRASSYQPLFEDRRARNVGDTLTITINEKLNASKTASTNTDRKGSTSFNLADVKFGNTNILKGGSIT